ncbi:major structural protein [Thermus phage YS40_Isch]|nr:major structural protein [Thermus phage YS40_Isch]
MPYEHLKHLDEATLKALNAAGQVAESLEREDLEPELTQLNVLDTPLTDLLSKNAVKAKAYEHEYNVVTARHDKIGYAAFREGGLPRTVEVNVARRRIRPMLVGHRITVTELATRTTQNGVMQIDELVKREKMIAVANEFEYLAFYGDNLLGDDVPGSPNNLQQDGIINIIKRGAPQNVLDAQGKPLSIDLLWEAESRVVSTQAFANPTAVFISYVDKLNLQASFYQISRVMTTADRRAGLLGADAQSYIGVRGEHSLYPSQFLGDFHKFNPARFGAEVGDFAAPSNSWTVNSTVTFVTLPYDSGLGDPNNATVYSYAFKAANFYGESAAKYVDVSIATADAGKGVQFQFNGLVNVKWLDVYRKDPGSQEFKFYKRVKVSTVNGDFTWVDDGHETVTTPSGVYRWKKIPGTGVVVGIDPNVTTMAVWIGMELYRLPPALTHDYVVWKVASVFSRAPEFNFLIVNVGQEPIV